MDNLCLHHVSQDISNRVNEILGVDSLLGTRAKDVLGHLLTPANSNGYICDNGNFARKRAETYFREMALAVDYIFLLQDHPEVLQRELTLEGHPELWEESQDYEEEGFDGAREYYVHLLMKHYTSMEENDKVA